MASAKEPEPEKKMGLIKKGALAGATAGVIFTIAVQHQAAIREGHVDEKLSEIKAQEADLNRWRRSDAWNEWQDFARQERIDGKKAWLKKYAKGERARAKTLRSLVKYPLPAGFALGTGIGALAALRRKRKAMKKNRPKRRRR